MKFEYCVELKEGFKPVMQTEKVNEFYFTIDAPNRATAERMVKAMLLNADNVVECSGICIDE